MMDMKFGSASPRWLTTSVPGTRNYGKSDRWRIYGASKAGLGDGWEHPVWPMGERMRKWLAVRGYQIHEFPDVVRWDGSQLKAAAIGKVVNTQQA